ncbi:MAG: OadG family protein, partial [Spirochaetaceae bacterium]|nr:OadG family protein [Spirochaetaceae bacterium]
MTIGEMFGQSAVLALLGMATVFGFLVLLVICISISGKVIHAFGLDKDTAAPAKAGAPAGMGSASSGRISPAVVSAITAAV